MKGRTYSIPQNDISKRGLMSTTWARPYLQNREVVAIATFGFIPRFERFGGISAPLTETFVADSLLDTPSEEGDVRGFESGL